MIGDLSKATSRLALSGDDWISSLLVGTLRWQDYEVIGDFSYHEDWLRRTEGVEIKCNELYRFLALARRWPLAVEIVTKKLKKLDGKVEPYSDVWIIIKDSENGKAHFLDVVVKPH